MNWTAVTEHRAKLGEGPFWDEPTQALYWVDIAGKQALRLIGALPGQIGIATFSPRLDAHGNSVRGVSLFERFSTDMGMHLMEVPPPARSSRTMLRRSRSNAMALG